MKRIWAWMACAVAAGTPVGVRAENNHWTRAESAHFIVYSNAAEDRARGFVERLEAFDEQTEKLYRQIGDSELPDQGKHIFYYLNKIDDYNTVQPGSTSEYGITYQPYTTCPFEDSRYFGINMGEAKQAQTSEYLNLDLAYTYFAYVQTKHIKFFSAPLPRWVDVGLKNYLMTMNIEPDKVVVGQMLPELAASLNVGPKHYVPLSTIVAGGAMPRGADMTALEAESWFLVHWLVSTPENRQMLVAYINKTRDGEDGLKAFVEATGKNPDDLMPVYKDYLAKGVPVQVFARGPVSADAVTMTAVPDYGQPVPLLDAAISACSSVVHRKTLMSALRPIAKAHPEDPLVQRTWLRGEVLIGDLAIDVPAAEAALETVVAAHPDDVEALTLLGQAHLRLAEGVSSDFSHADYAAARAALGKAYTLAPSSPTILALFSRARADLPGYPDDQAVQAMDLAESYSSGVYRLYVLELDLRRGDYDAASKLLADEHPEHMKGEWQTRMAAVIEGVKAHKPKAEILLQLVAYEQLRFHQ